MTVYARQDDSWTEIPVRPGNRKALEVRAPEPSARPEVQFLDDGTAVFHLTGADPRPNTDTTHTVARIDPASASGAPVFAVHADGRDLVFEELGSTPDASVSTDALDQVRSALNEILVPVYIDDVVSDLSERASGLFVLHTAQYRDDGAEWSYFRVAAFEGGVLALEEEHGSL